MGEESPERASTSAGAVFLSYAAQDAEAAQKICGALRAAGTEVWFDQSELRGGDVWDRQIRQQIHDCRLFIAVISAHTEARDEGYFRREWRLAVERAGDMAEDKAFVVPVAIDGTSERGARVPDPFKQVQWTRLPGGETTSAFVERVRRLLSPDSSPDRGATLSGSTSVPISLTSVRHPWRSKAGLWVTGAVIAVALAAIAVDRFSLSRRSPPPTPPAVPPTQTAAPAPATAAAFNPPPHSIAVLPFVNISGDKEQEYFSDGLTEELLNSLSRINELQVAARTSAFYFKGEHVDLSTVAHKLNVASVLEGSVRRSGHTIRVTAQLNNAVTGFHMWSQTYDRDLGDVLALQADIANAVAEALKVSVLGNQTARIELGGTRNPAAFDAYLRASQAYRGGLNERGLQDAIAGYSEAIRLDPTYPIAYASRSIALQGFALNWARGDAIRDYRKRAQLDARKAISLAPDLADGHLALAFLLEGALEFMGASQEYQRTLALAPGNAKVLRYYGIFAVEMGQTEAGLAAAHRSVVLDPLNYQNHVSRGTSEVFARRNAEAIVALRHAKALAPNEAGVNAWLGIAYYQSGDYQSARVACESADELNKPSCLAMVYDKLGRHGEAKAILARYQAELGDAAAVFYALIYSEWGDTARALDWLETAVRRHDRYLIIVKMAPGFDPLRNEPRFQAIERALKFPN